MLNIRLLLLLLNLSLLTVISSHAVAARDEGDSPFINSEVNNLPYDREWLKTLEREAESTFKAERLRLVYCDGVSGNCLFRSNLPLKEGKFAYDDLLVSMRRAYRARFGSSLPARFELVDVSLLNWFTDAQALQVEKKFFREHPARGRFIHHAIYGALFSPDAYPDTLRNWLEVLPSMGEINELQDDLGHIISTVRDRPQMVVVHCRAGYDRTGEAIAAFKMRYLGMKYRDAYAEANTVAKRSLKHLNRYGLMWYAYYLRNVLGLSSVGDIE